jgi:phage terminase large subunit-like protein
MHKNIPTTVKTFMLPNSHYDPARADRAVNFIGALRHTKGQWKGQPFKLLAWQEDIVRTVFGVINENGYRQCRTCYVFVSKKNGKTSLAAAIALYLLLADGESGAEIYSCAADRQQASLIYREAVAMARECKALARRIKIVESQKRIVYPATYSFYQVLSSEAYSHHGLNPHAVLFDETHVADREMFRVMTHGSSDARTQPLHLFITTAGNNIHSIGYELHQKALDIRDGRKVDHSFLPVIYAVDEGDDWTDPQVWRKANPSLGATIPMEALVRACESARQNPGEENSFRQLRLNIWVKQSIRWMPMKKWDECGGIVDAAELEGRACYAGLDLSSTTDLTALVLAFPPEEEDEPYTVLPFFWLPDESLSLRVRRDHVMYDIWAKQGFIQTTDGNVVHYGHIEQYIAKLGERYNIREIAYDRWNAAMMVQALEDDGFTMVPFGQGFRDMSPPTKELMRLVLERKLNHGGHPVLRWNIDNVFVRTDPAGNLKIDKAKSTEKVDGAVALVMALDRALKNRNTGSVYDERGILWI